MYQATTLAGTGGHYVRLTALRTPRGGWGCRPFPVVTFYGATLDFGAGTLTVSNGATEVTLDLAQAEKVQEPGRESDAVRLSAPVRHPARLYAFSENQRVDVLILPLETYEVRNNGVATQAVMHTPRKYHGPGLYPETTKWGKWINTYRREAEERAVSRDGGR
ncbi:hypothetical protein [Pseudarthrobacter sp. BIM B-2242]|uniref:hypothetical protein n=1 Tax=Pseudarthrobacter sp. BIM B-2242 TaxID=2772401 RepID=UPI00168A5E64|nr:hypothetical protein [Pseudarthrobacter sp. BIM B-2242]QOD05962.1 hypothetical protein IDT60_20550 [Pseudarthrobacter sp. BIM B-2242]